MILSKNACYTTQLFIEHIFASRLERCTLRRQGITGKHTVLCSGHDFWLNN